MWHFDIPWDNNWSVHMTSGLHEMLWPRMCKDLHPHHLNVFTAWYLITGAILRIKKPMSHLLPLCIAQTYDKFISNNSNYRCLHDCHEGNWWEKELKHKWINSCNMSPQMQITVITKAHHYFLCRNLFWYLPTSATSHIQSLEIYHVLYISVTVFFDK
jgi:hypothetical protein